MQINIRRGSSSADAQGVTTYALPDDAGADIAGGWRGASVSTALHYLQRSVDPSLGYALSCRRGLCDVCAVRIDGVVRTACTTMLTDDMLIEPAKESIRLHDTVVELSLIRKHRI